MKQFTTILLGLLLLSGCSSTAITGVWKDPQFSGEKLQNVLIIGITPKDLAKRIYEDTFVKDFKAQGVSGSASYTIVPADKQEDVDVLRQLIKDKGFKYLLITSIVDKKTLKITHPSTTYNIVSGGSYYNRNNYYGSSYSRNWNDYYTSSYTTDAVTTETEQVILETNIYEATSAEIIYSIQTDTLLDYGAEKSIGEIVKAIVDNLKKNGLL